MKSYRNLLIWQKGMDLAGDCWLLTRAFPREELFAITSQIRRAASSIPANVAEGYGREGRKEYIHFLRIAQGSLKELETHLLLSARVDLCSAEQISTSMEKAEELGRILWSLIRRLSEQSRE